MNIMDALFGPANMHNSAIAKREGDAFQGSFRDLLEGGREQAEQDATHVAAITPEIGSAALRFEERGLVGSAATQILSQLAITPSDQSAQLTQIAPASQEQPVELAQQSTVSPVTARDGVELTQKLERVLEHLRSAARTQPEGQAKAQELARAPAPAGSPGSSNAASARSADLQAIGSRTELRAVETSARPAASAVPTQGTARSETTAPRAMQAPARAQPAQQMPGSSGQQTPYSALLVPQGEGMRLIIRAPNLSADELGRLEERIARMFAKRGLAAPETVIHQPASSGAEGNF